MKFTISWLKEHLDTQKSDQELIDSLTNIGLEVEDVVNASEIFSNFIVAQVVEEKNHSVGSSQCHFQKRFLSH